MGQYFKDNIFLLSLMEDKCFLMKKKEGSTINQ